MKVVKDIQNFIQLIHSREEVIVFPFGAEGDQVLEFLRYTNFLNRVCCIAAPQVELGFAQRFVHELPIIPLENLVHFLETSIFIVVAPDSYHLQINELITRFGFKEIIFVGDELQSQIRNALQGMANSGQIMTWYMNHLDKKILNLNYQISNQFSMFNYNTNAFGKYRNAFRGKDVVIVGGGPTINYYEPIPDAIHIALNHVSWKREDISFDYLFTGDHNINLEYLFNDEGNITVKPKPSNLTIEQAFKKIKDKVFVYRVGSGSNDEWEHFPEYINISADNIVYFQPSKSDDLGQFIQQDICCYTLAFFISIAFPALHFALFTYPKRIFLVGCDTSKGGHFYDQKQHKEKRTPDLLQITPMKVGYARMKMFAKHYYPDTEIISINPVGLRGLFKDIYTEDYLNTLG